MNNRENTRHLTKPLQQIDVVDDEDDDQEEEEEDDEEEEFILPDCTSNRPVTGITSDHLYYLFYENWVVNNYSIRIQTYTKLTTYCLTDDILVLHISLTLKIFFYYIMHDIIMLLKFTKLFFVRR